MSKDNEDIARDRHECIYCKSFVRPQSCSDGNEVDFWNIRDCYKIKTQAWMERRHRAAIRDLYLKNGVGSRVDQRLAFWKNKNGEFFISHNPTDKQTVMLLEDCWLFDQFPEDFKFC